MNELKVMQGDPLSASKWNRLVDRTKNDSAGAPAALAFMSRVECMIRNDSGADRDIGECLVIDDYDGPTATDLYSIPGNVELSCIAPVWHTNVSRLVILAEPIPDGEAGVAVLSGHCLAKASGDDDFVMLDPTDTNVFKSATSGIARTIARVDSDYALINFRDSCDWWQYELTQASQAPSATTAKLIGRDGVEFASSINLSDPLSLMDDQASGDKGFCRFCGNDFEAVTGPCT